MTDERIRSVPVNDLNVESGAQELVRSERMKPYLALLKAQMGGQDTEPYLDALAALPLEERYVWRVISALKWAFCDLDTDSATADLHTLSEEDLKKVVEPLTLRAIQFCLFVNALLGEDATGRIMQQAVRCARESQVQGSGE
jgi:thioesterase domain-containing protein